MYNINELIYELLQYRRSSLDDTKEFLDMKHNSSLCPMLQETLENIVGSFQKYHKITYDMQGVNDQGTDILLRMTENDETKYICFQIKSEDDLKDKDYLKNLKAQYVDTKEKYTNFEDYYIVICCNEKDKKNKDKIRNIEAALAKHDKIQIIEPRYALSFMKLKSSIIYAYIKNKLSDDDIVYRKAIDIINDLTPSEIAIIFYAAYSNIYLNKQYISEEDILNSAFIQETYNKVPDCERSYFFEKNDDLDQEDIIESDEEMFPSDREKNLETRVVCDLDYLSNIFLDVKSNNKYSIVLEQIYPIVAIMIDGNIRYGYEGDELLRYLINIRQL